MNPNPFNQAFSPQSAKDSFTAHLASSANRPADSRDLFYRLMHISEHYSVLAFAFRLLTCHFQDIKQHYQSQFSKKYSGSNLSTLLSNPVNKPDYVIADASIHACLKQFAPIILTVPAWLPQIAQTATNQAPIAIDLMAIYTKLTEGKRGIAEQRDIFYAHLLSAGQRIQPLHTQAFTQDNDIDDACFDFGAIQLLLGQFPRVFFPEILGFTCAFVASPSIATFFVKADGCSILDDAYPFSMSDLNKAGLVDHLDAVIKQYLDEFDHLTDDLWQRIQCGFWLYQYHLGISAQRINGSFHTLFSPRQSVEKLLAELIPRAIGHHGNIRLGGKTIDEWFKATPFKSENFLATLLHSPYVDRTKPENSKLLKLFDFNGPMFGVLDDQGKATIKEWLLTELNPGLMPTKKHKPAVQKLGLRSINEDPTQKLKLFEFSNDIPTLSTNKVNFAALSNRDLYYYLVNYDLFPDSLDAGKLKVNRLLAFAKTFNRLPFSTYTHGAFDAYIEKTYRGEVAAFKPLTKQPKLSKAAFIWGIEQFAPTILTDGSWLQGAYQLDFSTHHGIGEVLQKIYRDELGNGSIQQNHPHIYQQLLQSVGLNLPPVYSKEFTLHKGFIDTAFDIPIFFMALSKFSNAYLPELLGLNMAIELSGLGNVYLRLSQELKYWHINPAIVDVHTSIDNLATGHSALAKQAIKAYLDEVASSYGSYVMNAHWRRIYTGYCSLQTASKLFKYSLIVDYLFKKSYTRHQ
jgi:hypothetical protein